MATHCDLIREQPSTAFLFRRPGNWWTFRARRAAAPSNRNGSSNVRLNDIRLASRVGQAGQGLAEYALILALIAVLAILALTFLGGQINQILSEVGTAI